MVDFSSCDQINRNLLQVTTADRAFVIDLTSGRCIHDFCDMSQLLSPEYFIPAHVNLEDCQIEDRVMSTEYADVNKAKDFFLIKKKFCHITHH